MNLVDMIPRLVNATAVSGDERALICCRLAKELEEAGDYEQAWEALGEFVRGVGERPRVEGLGPLAAAEIILRAGVLSGYLGSSHQIEGAQEAAKNLISESERVFGELGAPGKANEARVEIAVCYWREGGFDEARVVLRGVLDRLGENDTEQRAMALLRGAIVERSATRYNDAFRLLMEAAPLFSESADHAVKGKFHNQLALVLNHLGEAESREDYIDRALVEYAAASYHFEQAGHLRYGARVENNLGFLFSTVRKFEEAHTHLDRARELFARLGDSGSIAQVDETRMRVFNAEGRCREAVALAESAVHALEKGGEQSLLAVALTTYGTALARIGRGDRAEATLRRAAEVAEDAGDREGAGLASLALIEELSGRFDAEELGALYRRADELLSRLEQPDLLQRLRRCARTVFAAGRGDAPATAEPRFVYASERTGELLGDARLIARAGGPVLLTGETGTGKELLARLIHAWSGRTGKLITINCATLSEALFESQVFGHRRGSFTDAHEDAPGAARSAAGGTLFLDEIVELSLTNQVKLLRLIEHGEVRSVGDPAPERVDVRIVAATNSNVGEMVARGRFREDLFYRLQAFRLELPPLRERTEDVRALAAYFVEGARARQRKEVTFTHEAVEAICRLPLRGNVRELQSLVEHAVLIAPAGSVVTSEEVEALALGQVAEPDAANAWENFSLKDEIHRIEERFIELALQEAGGKVSHAARLLGFKHHESLNSLLKHRHRKLLQARTAVTPRRRSIIRVPKV